MTAPNAFLVDLNSTITPNVGVSVDTSGAPTMLTQDSSGNQVSTPVGGGGGGGTPASSISPKAAGTGAVGSALAYARQDHAHPVNDGVDIGLINSTQKTQIAAGATTALLNAAKTALKDPAGGADVNLGVSTFNGLTDKTSADIVGTNTGVAAALATKITVPTAWAASAGGGTPTLTSGTAVLGTAFRNTTTGYTTFTTPIDTIPGVNFGDILECFTSGTYTLTPANNIIPPLTLGATYTLLSSDNGRVFSTPVNCVVTVPTGLGSGFGCGFMGSGAVTFAGTAAPTDNRKTGSTAPFCGLVCSSADTYQARGEKA
jgi:hypothetical protein